MRSSRPDLVFIAVAILAVAVVAGLTWGNYQYTQQNSGGNDFIARWVGTRQFITSGQSPYSPQTTQVIQHFVFGGRQAQAGEDLHLFVYPHYSMLVFMPFSLIADYPLARAAWMSALEISLVVIAFSSLALTRWRPPTWMLGLYLLFALLWYHAVRPVINGNPAVVVALFITLMLSYILAKRDMAAGSMLALATIKPQMVVLLVPFVLYWAYSRKRYRLITSFLLAMTVLVGGSMLFERDWIIKNLQQIISYPSYTKPGTPGVIFENWWPGVGSTLGWVLPVAFGLLLLREWLAAWNKDERWFLWTAGLTLVLTNLIGIRTTTANYVALFPVLVLVFSVLEQRWGRTGRWVVVVSLLGFLVGLWWLFIDTFMVSDQGQQHTIMFFPVPVFLFIGLYWIRYWALGSRKMAIQQLEALRRI